MKAGYDIEADWILNTLCNFDCAYCDNHSKREHPAVSKLAVADVVQFFDSTNLTWMVHLTGGEPFFHPQFMALCARLTDKHFISVNTNLTSRRVYKFAEAIDPRRVGFVHTGLHILERERRQGIRDFIDKFHHLKARGFNIFVSYVVYPPLIERLASDFEFFKSEGIVIIPKALRGPYGAHKYPESYTPAERAIFAHFSTQAESLLDEFDASSLGERPTINPLADRHFLEGFPDYRGQDCWAGVSFVRVLTSGTITRCGRRRILGNLFRNKLNLLSEPQPCDDKTCQYFCLKYLANGQP